jgi:hypothetical protein
VAAIGGRNVVASAFAVLVVPSTIGGKKTPACTVPEFGVVVVPVAVEVVNVGVPVVVGPTVCVSVTT